MSTVEKFRALHAFTQKYPNTMKSWEFVDPSNYNEIRVYTDKRILTVQYDPETEKITIAQNEANFEDFSALRCPHCGSTKVNTQIVSESQLKDKHHGCIWWLFIGWWWLPVKWIFFTFPALIFKLFVPKRQVIVTEHFPMNVCQSCGHTWKPQK